MIRLGIPYNIGILETCLLSNVHYFNFITVPNFLLYFLFFPVMLAVILLQLLPLVTNTCTPWNSASSWSKPYHKNNNNNSSSNSKKGWCVNVPVYLSECMCLYVCICVCMYGLSLVKSIPLETALTIASISVNSGGKRAEKLKTSRK